ncbi:DUF692 domain-containing protein [Thiotrichales bacterium 19S3-7]|nr:DUF692 domain-containing protein [Thiotrichales bacterium 19S3-7]MCF6802447.1 DUF692 domain-containing protein [Thiotrichales bacterium 19S3-11]
MSHALSSIDNQIGICGLGLRPELLDSLIQLDTKPVDFLEVAPENWLGVGGRKGKYFQSYTEIYPVICHGLSLSIGGIAPIDIAFVKRLKQFFDTHQIQFYSEHLSYCSDDYGQLYDLMPMPFTEEAVSYVAKRVKQVQDILERPIALENVSYYAKLPGDLTEADFINAVLEESNCLLLLDINNIYVNSVNHDYDPLMFLSQMPKDKIAYFHIAGHWQKSPNLIIDTHGDRVIEPVWNLLNKAYDEFGLLPTLLERDNDIPELAELLDEINHLKKIQMIYQKECQLYEN